MAGYIPLDSGRTEGGPGDAAPAGLPFSSPAPFPVLRVLAKGGVSPGGRVAPPWRPIGAGKPHVPPADFVR